MTSLSAIPVLAAFCFALPMRSAAEAAGAAAVAAFEARYWKINASKSIPYRLFAPKNRMAGKKYPVMLCFHGAGERGNDNVSQLNHAFTTMWADDSIQKDNPGFVVVPQCPANEDWNGNTKLANYDFTQTPITQDMQAVMDILDSLEKEFPIDRDREYVSGMSMGGAATWYAIMKFPERFAAAVPVCGRGDPNQASNLDRVNIWAFHAADDPTVPVTTTRELVKAIRAIGGSRLKYTEYPASMGYGHESWKPAGRDPALHRWVFGMTRAQSTAMAPTPVPREAFRLPEMPRVFFDGLGRLRSRETPVARFAP